MKSKDVQCISLLGYVYLMTHNTDKYNNRQKIVKILNKIENMFSFFP